MTETPTFRRVIRKELSEEATFEQRCEEKEGVTYIDVGREGVLDRETSTRQVPEKGAFFEEYQG